MSAHAERRENLPMLSLAATSDAVCDPRAASAAAAELVEQTGHLCSTTVVPGASHVVSSSVPLRATQVQPSVHVARPDHEIPRLHC